LAFAEGCKRQFALILPSLAIARHRSVDAQHPAIPARSFAKLRSGQEQTKHLGQVLHKFVAVDAPNLW
jgi:hypothetical protein